MSNYSNNRGKKHYPVKKKYYPKSKNVGSKPFSSLLGNNMVDNMRFGTKGHDLSGYIKREIIIKDRYGNTQIAREQQFFNSAEDLNVKINQNEKSRGRY